MKNKTTAALLALFLGSFGFHQFYLKKTLKGLLYLLFFWTFIPTILALIDFIILITMSDATFNEKYNKDIILDNNIDVQGDYNAYIRYTKDTDLSYIEHGEWKDKTYNKVFQELIKDYRHLINVPGNEFRKDPRLKDFRLKEDVLNRINVKSGYTNIKYFDYLSTFLDKE